MRHKIGSHITSMTSEKLSDFSWRNQISFSDEGVHDFFTWICTTVSSFCYWSKLIFFSTEDLSVSMLQQQIAEISGMNIISFIDQVTSARLGTTLDHTVYFGSCMRYIHPIFHEKTTDREENASFQSRFSSISWESNTRNRKILLFMLIRIGIKK